MQRLPLAAAAYGLGCAIALATLTLAPPHPGQLPGALLFHGIDARAPMRMMLLAMLCPFIAAFALTPLLRRANTAVSLALASGLAIAMIDPSNVLAVVLLPLILAAAAFVIARIQWGDRRPRLSSRTKNILYPLLCLALAWWLSPLRVEGAPRLDIFEDGHWLMPANEMLHGAVPYRDQVPGHGLISDGLLDYVVMRLGASTPGAVLWVRQLLGLAGAPLLYAVALALTGSAEAALLTVLAAASMMITGSAPPIPLSVLDTIVPIRSLAALAALACCLLAARRQDPKPLAAAGALAVLATLTSVDYGLYAFVVLFVTILRLSEKRRAVLRALTGVAVVTIPAAIAMTIAGCLVPFLRVTLFDVPRLSEPYAMQFFYWPPQHDAILGFPDVLAGLFLPRTVWIIVWALVAIGTAAAVATIRPPHPVADPLIVAGSWVVVCALAYGERAHVMFMPVALAVLVGAIYAIRAHRTAFAFAALTLAVACAPTQFLLRARNLRPDPSLVRYDGVLLDARNARRLAFLKSITDRTLGPNDTFLDFANMPGLYYLLDRRCAIRQPEVCFYEPEELQREVIAAIERNPHVRLALMQFTNRDDVWIDGVPNPARAPLVFAYLREHFQPLAERDGVVVWIRR